MATLSILEPILIVDDDISVANLLASTLAELDLRRIDTCSSGEEASKKIASKQYNLIILDWKMPGVSGLTLFNRIRQLENYFATPVLVISGYLGVEDFRLLEEFPYSGVLAKPFGIETIEETLNSMAADKKWSDSAYPQIENILSQIEDFEKLKHSIAVIISNSPKPEPLGIFAARNLLARDKIREAEMVLQILLKKAPRCAVAMTVMGQVQLMLKNVDAAQAILLKAQKLCPDNIARLCLLGQTKLEKLELEEAQSYFNSAFKLDRSDSKASDGKTFVAEVSSFIKTRTIDKVGTNFSSLVNMMGISLIKAGQFDAGIKHYEKAWKFTSATEPRYKLAYNLGLAYLKWDKLDSSFDWFSTSLTLSHGSFEKSRKCAEHLAQRNPAFESKFNELKNSFSAKSTSISALPDQLGEFEEDQLLSGNFKPNQQIKNLVPIESPELIEKTPIKTEPSSNTPELTASPSSQQDLIEVVPECKQLISYLHNKGYPIDLHVDGYLKIYREFGRKIFTVGAKAAIKKKTPTHLALRSIVEELARHLKGAA